MKTIEIDISKTLSKKELNETYQLNDLKKGDKIKLVSNENEFVQKAMILMFIALFIIVFFKNKQNSTDKIEALINVIFDKYDSEEDLEKEIEAELGIDFKFETRQKKHDAIDELFGKWKNIDVDLKQIRQKSWVKSK
jgi:hypothetical protein